ncbi:MAG: cysteine dioxygenase [Gammaproteobacteria bacterium]
MTNINSAPALEKFTAEVSSTVDRYSNEAEILPKITASLKNLVSEDNWLDPSCAQEHPDYYQQYLLYLDPAERFSVVSFVWGPGQTTPIHDHTVWGAIGILRGAEFERSFDITPGQAPAPRAEEHQLLPGDVGLVSPTIGDVHQVRNAFDDRVSISIHIYGGNIGKISRHVFPAEGGAAKDFISGYSNPS